MADLSINTRTSAQIGGQNSPAAENFNDIGIQAEYENDSVQPKMTIDALRFVLESRQRVLDWYYGSGAFEGLPYKQQYYNINNERKEFEGLIDFRKEFEDFPDEGLLTVGLDQENGIDIFFTKVGTLTFGYLESIGVITSSDYTNMDYVVEKKFNTFEIIMTGIVIYLMAKEIAESIKRIAQDIALVSSIAASGLTGSIGAAIYAVSIAIINIAYTAVLVIAIIDLMTDLVQAFLPPRRTHKVMRLSTMMQKLCSHFGYTFVTSVTEFDSVYYQPSNLNVDSKSKLGFIKVARGTSKGIPNQRDIGYNCEEFVDMMKKLCYGKIAVIGKEVHLRPKDDPFWQQTSQFTYPDVLLTNKSTNGAELVGTFLASFQTDLNDDYTIDNYRGTSIEVKTDVINAQNQNNVLIDGFEEINFGVALANRKDSLNSIETLLKQAGSIIDRATRALGGRSNFANKVKTRVGLAKQSSNWNSIPKLVYLSGSKIPINHRDLFGADVLINKYYGDKSFVSNNFRGQKAYYLQQTIPFGFEDYKKLVNNSFFTYKGAEAKIIKFVWNTGSDTAVVDFWVREVYSTNLREIKIVQE